MSNETTRRTVRIEDELWEASKAEFKKRGTTISDEIRGFLQGELDKPAMHRASRDEVISLYQQGLPFAEITELTGYSKAGILNTKQRHGIPDRPQRTDGTLRRQA